MKPMVLFMIMLISAVQLLTAQESDKPDTWKPDGIRHGPMMGVSGWNNLTFKAGYHWCFTWVKGEKESERGRGLLFGASVDWQVIPPRGFIPMITARYCWGKSYSSNWFPEFGVDFFVHTDLRNANSAIRPVAGIQSSYGVSLLYGYSFRTDAQPYILPSRHNVQLTAPVAILLLPLLWIMD